MAVKRFSGSFRTRDDVFDNITPNNVVVAPTGGVAVPAGEFKPADWLPVAWQGTASQDYFVIGSGKVVSMTKRGNICHGGLKAVIANATAASGADTFLTYSSADVDAKTKDIRTGVEVAAGTTTVTLLQAATGLLDRGLVREDILGAAFAGTTAECQTILDDFISDPVGVAAYDVYHWAGDITDERGLNFTNYSKQHLVQFFTQAQMQMPVIGLAQVTGVDISSAAAVAYSSGLAGASFPSADIAGAPVFVTSAELSGFARYSDEDRPSMLIESGDPVVGYALATDGSDAALARHTSRTPYEDGNSAGIFVNKRDSISALGGAGDFYVDAEARIVIVRSDAWDAAGASNTATVTDLSYYGHSSTATSSDDQLVSLLAVNDAKPGDTIGYDELSNFTVDATGTLGRVVALKEEPRGLLDRVRTGFQGSSFDASMQMPGSATGGFTDLITLSNETVSDRVAVLLVNFL